MATLLDAQKTELFLAEQPVDLLHRAQDLTKTLSEELISSFQPGMLESEAQAIADKIFRSHSIVHSWHVPYIRFGKHTTLTFFDAQPSEDIRLQENDIAFIDIGPVFKLTDENGKEHLIEGDYGLSRVFGDNPAYQQIADASQHLYEQGLTYWKTTNATGAMLDQYLRKEAGQLGYTFQLPKGGHLLGPFSHSKNGYKGYLSEFDATLLPDIWILEVQLANQEQTYGAFYEDLLH